MPLATGPTWPTAAAPAVYRLPPGFGAAFVRVIIGSHYVRPDAYEGWQHFCADCWRRWKFAHYPPLPPCSRCGLPSLQTRPRPDIICDGCYETICVAIFGATELPHA